MKIRPHFILGCVALLGYFATLAVPGRAWAILVASDNASNSAYAANANGAWQGQNSNPITENPPGTDNGGSGFLPWSFAGGYHFAPASPYQNLTHFIDGVDFPTTSNNHLGAPAFGIGNGGIPYGSDFTTARRPFAQPLAVGETFSLDIVTPILETFYPYNYPFVGIEFYDSNGATLKLAAGAGDNDGNTVTDTYYPWGYNDANHVADAGDFGFDAGAGHSLDANLGTTTLSFKQTSSNTAHVTFGGAGLDVTLLGGAPSAVFFWLYDNNSVADGNGNPTGEHALYFNNLKIVGIDGDYNGDGRVDAADYVMWRKNLGSGTSLPHGDDTPGVGNDDYTRWRAHFGATSAVGTALVSAAGVPEPSAVLLVFCGWIALPLRFAVRR